MTEAATVDSGLVKAAAVVGFNPEKIISDALFYDGNAMSAAEIQSFLDSKIGRCENGKCLNVLTASISSRDAWYSQATGDLVCSALQGGTMRVSELIYRVQVACGISAKVILVTLQKEQGLTTSSAPSDWNLRAAMGASCPDTEPCDPAYSGVGPQIVQGVRQLKIYKAGKFAKQPGVNFIGYNPNSACGGTNINIQNYATAALYNYTPYQPNAAALAAGWGLGDGCSSYGNRNFFNYYTSWFGSTTGAAANRASGAIIGVDPQGAVLRYPFAAGAFTAPAIVATASKNAKLVVPVGDFDGDGRRDFVSVNDSYGASLTSLDPGATTVTTALAVDWSTATHVVAGGDFLGTGAPGVFTSDAGGGLYFWPGDGYGRFLAPIQAGSGWQQMSLYSGGVDVDGDGYPDLIARDANGFLMIYPGDGHGGWLPRRVFGPGWQSIPVLFSPGDFSGDGVADLIAKDAAGRLWLYRATEGTYVRDASVGSGWSAMRAIAPLGPTPSKPRAYPGGAGDLNRDGAPDVVATTQSGSVVVYPGNGAGGWKPEVKAATIDPGDRIATVGDFDGDGVSDLVRITGGGAFMLLRGKGDGTFSAGDKIGSGWSGLEVIGGLDFNGDRRVDVLARNAAGYLYLFRGDGNGGWVTGQGELVGMGWEIFDQVFHAGDFNGDGYGDIVARKRDGTLWMYPTSGNGAWLTPRQIGLGWDVMTWVFGPGDFDGNGTADIVGRRADGSLALYRGDGSGGWAGSTTIGVGWDIMRAIN